MIKFGIHHEKTTDAQYLEEYMKQWKFHSSQGVVACFGHKIQLQASKATANLWSTMELKIMKIWCYVCHNVSLPGGLNWDHRWLTEHQGIMATEFSAVPIAQLVEHLPCKWKVLGSVPSWGSAFWHTHTQMGTKLLTKFRGACMSPQWSNCVWVAYIMGL